MRILWVGEYTEPDLVKELMEWGYRPMSITVAQRNLTEGLETIQPIDSLSGCRLPYQKKIKRFKGKSWIDSNGGEHVFVDLITAPYLELLYKRQKMVAAAREWIRRHRDEQCSVIVYGLHSPYLACAKAIKKINPDVKVVCIVPDLPEYYDFNPSRIKRILKKIDLHMIYRNLSIIDKYVLFAESMKDYLKVPADKYIVMEGCFNLKETDEETRPKEIGTKKVLFYSGSLNKGYGIERLLEAFRLVKAEAKLRIAGIGSEEGLVQRMASEDNRIEYLSYISDRNQLSDMQREADILLCVIPPENKATEYCFPSKIIEYMKTGNVTMTHRLKGIPIEYYKYIIPFDSTTAEGMANSIDKVLAMPSEDLQKRGYASKEYVLQNKNNIRQARRIFDFMSHN